MKKIIFLLLSFFSIIFVPQIFAAGNSFVSIVNPVRGSDFWNLKNQNIETAVHGQIEILKEFNLPATWLIRFDALDNKVVIDQLRGRSSDEKGLFLEITPTLATGAKVQYHQSDIWHAAGSAFLTGYERPEREKLINTAFEKFRSIFGNYPSSVGAWWIDSYSLDYMQKKYGVNASLIVADQYSTDNYQIWGQYFGTPYYPAKNNALHSAGNVENKLDVVMMQWASRDPVNGYGNGVEESTFSVQANDYLDYHDLDNKYFSSLVDIYTKQKFNQFGQLVVGLENSYEWNIYDDEYRDQIKILAEKFKLGQLSVVTMKDFSGWYRKSFPGLSPTQIIIADDPLGSFKKVVWFMDPYYRAGWFLNSDGSVFRDIRQYIDGEEELCFKVRCDSVNFATSATRVLDDVSFGHKWIIDEGKISDFNVRAQGENYILSYQNEAKNLREIVFLSRDISIDGKIFSIDVAILNAIKTRNVVMQNNTFAGQPLKWSLLSVVLKILEFVIFFSLAIILPGFIITRTFLKKESSVLLRLFVSGSVGFVVLTTLFYMVSLLKIRQLIFVYIAICLILFLRYSSSVARSYIKNINIYMVCSYFIRTIIKQPLNLIIFCIILAGTVFQTIPTFKSGLNFSYGSAFWGPNTHDGVWHMALINQLVKATPPENPVYSGTILKNYHFFYDLLIAATNCLSKLPVSDLVFRFYPIVFSLMLGVGFYYLIRKLFEERIGGRKMKIVAFFSLYLIYFAGSFGWIVEFLRERHFGGESAFWSNQAVSFNLNPPFALSMVIFVALLNILFSNTKGIMFRIVLIILIATLASFKSYTGVLVLGALFTVAAVRIIRNKDFNYFWTAMLSLSMTILLFLSNFQVGSALIIFAPFWFIHAMVDSPDRVGWVRLTLARVASGELKQWPKFILVEAISLLLFVFGNLGLRFFSFGVLIKIKEIFKDDTLLFIFAMTILSTMIPILFIQSGNPWNTIQFFYPALYLTAFFSGLVIAGLIFKLNRGLAFILVCLVLVLAPINSLVSASGYFGKNPHAFVSAKELSGLQFLANEPDGIVLTFPYDDKLKTKIAEPWPILAYDSTAYVAAFSKKAVYLEDIGQNQILLTDYKKRLVASKDFFLKPVAESAKFLQENHIKYIYLPKIYNVRLDESSNIVRNIFENEEVVIYQVGD